MKKFFKKTFRYYGCNILKYQAKEFIFFRMKSKDSNVFIKSGYGSRIENILENSVELFKETGLNELASKWDIILKNYRRSSRQD